jgi:hypothetical protein
MYLEPMLKTSLVEYQAYFVVFYGKRLKEGVFTVYIRFDGPCSLKIADLERCFFGIVAQFFPCKDDSGLTYIQQHDVQIYRIENCPTQSIGATRYVYNDPILFMPDNWQYEFSLILDGPLLCGSLEYAKLLLPHATVVEFLNEIHQGINWPNGIIINCFSEMIDLKTLFDLCNQKRAVTLGNVIIPANTPLIIIWTSVHGKVINPTEIHPKQFSLSVLNKLSTVALIRMVQNARLFRQIEKIRLEGDPPPELHKQYVVSAIASDAFHQLSGRFSYQTPIKEIPGADVIPSQEGNTVQLEEVPEPYIPFPISRSDENAPNSIEELFNMNVDGYDGGMTLEQQLIQSAENAAQAQITIIENPAVTIQCSPPTENEEERLARIEKVRKEREVNEENQRRAQLERQEQELRSSVLQKARNDAFGPTTGNGNEQRSRLNSRSSDNKDEEKSKHRNSSHGIARKNIKRLDPEHKRREKKQHDGGSEKKKRRERRPETQEEREERLKKAALRRDKKNHEILLIKEMERKLREEELRKGLMNQAVSSIN